MNKEAFLLLSATNITHRIVVVLEIKTPMNFFFLLIDLDEVLYFVYTCIHLDQISSINHVFIQIM